MSLLMKALEKAAKDRDEARVETAEATPLADPTLPGGPAVPAAPATLPLTAPTASFSPGPKSELSLEPIPIPAEPSVSAPPARPEPSSRPAAAPRAARGAPSREQQAKAATVVKATGSGSGGSAAARL